MFLSVGKKNGPKNFKSCEFLLIKDNERLKGLLFICMSFFTKTFVWLKYTSTRIINIVLVNNQTSAYNFSGKLEHGRELN